MKIQSNAKKGFTLIELLTVIAILAILSAILVPTVGQFRTMAKKANDINNLRQIVQASSLYATQNGEWHVVDDQTVGTNGIENSAEGSQTIVDVAAVLALGAGLNDIKIWTSQSDTAAFSPGGLIITSDASTGAYDINSDLSDDLSYSYVVGLNTGTPTTTPIAFSRMEDTTASYWDVDDIYGNTGGHIAFTGGNVSWYENLASTDGGKLVDGNGDAADDIEAALADLPGVLAFGTNVYIRDGNPDQAPPSE